MAQNSGANNQQALLFTALAEQVKTPLIQIRHAAELSSSQTTTQEHQRLIDSITLAAESALGLIDSYNLSIAMQREQRFQLEPVPLSSVLYDTASRLESYAKAYGCNLELSVKGKHVPVMARKDVVEAALLSMGFSFIEASSGSKNRTITLSLSRNSQGISTGIFSGLEGLNKNLLKQARVLQGRARQPFKDLVVGSGAGIFVADALFNSIDSAMRVARLNKLHGLAVTLIPSRQLSLV